MNSDLSKHNDMLLVFLNYCDEIFNVNNIFNVNGYHFIITFKIQ